MRRRMHKHIGPCKNLNRQTMLFRIGWIKRTYCIDAVPYRIIDDRYTLPMRLVSTLTLVWRAKANGSRIHTHTHHWQSYLSIKWFAQRSRNFHSIVGCDSNQSQKLRSLASSHWNKNQHKSFLPQLTKIHRETFPTKIVERVLVVFMCAFVCIRSWSWIQICAYRSARHTKAVNLRSRWITFPQ